MSTIKGRIINIGHYTIHDGPGIRTTVFLKGCPARCLWCCSPESQSFDLEKSILNPSKVYGREVTVEELFAEVRRDEPFWRKSDGGVTLSGGEVLGQPEFAKEFLALCRSRFIHTAIETSLFAKSEIARYVINESDFVQFDLKAMAPKLHMELTGLDNELILDNASELLKSDKDILVRFPLIPKLNDSIENINALGKFVSENRKDAKVEILRYHKMGVGTYEELGLAYLIPFVNPPENEDVQKAADILRNYELQVIYQ
jgi:pyruvate formate lyase activating enzyme